ncbi:MAG TPA: TRAP transporter small permease [Acetomicrobium sp.]|jgi:TRAP-type C4-dicarboxylate transport system permease small subunit|nr:TRAP transporter small permease [Acetomicrobium sp.]
MLAELGGLLISIMVILFLLNIILRMIGKPLQGLLQIAVFSMVFVIYLGLAYTEETDQHVRIEVITTRVSLTTKKILRFLSHIIEACVIGICTYAVYRDAVRAHITKATITGTVPMRLWPVKSVIVVGLFVYLLQLIVCVKEDYKDLKIFNDVVELSDANFGKD